MDTVDNVQFPNSYFKVALNLLVLYAEPKDGIDSLGSKSFVLDRQMTHQCSFFAPFDRNEMPFLTFLPI